MKKRSQVIFSILIFIASLCIAMIIGNFLLINIALLIMYVILYLLYEKGKIKFSVIYLIRILVIFNILFYGYNIITNDSFIFIVEKDVPTSKEYLIRNAARITLIVMDLIILFLSFKNIKSIALTIILTILFSSIMWFMPVSLEAEHEHTFNPDIKDTYTYYDIKDGTEKTMTMSREEIHALIIYRNIFLHELYRYER